VRIVLKVHESAKPALERWRMTLGGTTHERDGAVPIPGTDPPSYWCGFPGGGLARVFVYPAARTWRSGYTRDVLVVELVFSPGPGH
jgi:hypothetical protein